MLVLSRQCGVKMLGKKLQRRAYAKSNHYTCYIHRLVLKSEHKALTCIPDAVGILLKQVRIR
jgi:hypothetical protein